MGRAAFDQLTAERFAILRLADRIQQAIARPATSHDLQWMVFDVIDGHDRLVRPMLDLEQRLLHEPVQQAAPDLWRRAEAGALDIVMGLQILRRMVEEGQPLRPVLEDAELRLRAFVADRAALMQEVRKRLPASLLAQVEYRLDDVAPAAPVAQSLTTQ